MTSASTMETWAKLTAGYGVLKGGIEGANKMMKKLSPEARKEKAQKKQKLKQDKGIAEIEGEASKESLYAHDSLMQEMADGLRSKYSLRKSEEAQTLANEHLTAKIQTLTGPDVAGQDISGVDSVAIITAIDKQTVDIITGLETHSPKDAGSPKLEPDAKFTSDSPEDMLLRQAESIWGSAKKDSVADAGSPKLESDAKFTSDSGETQLGVDETTAIHSHDDEVLEQVKETNVQLSPMKSALAELVDMAGDDLVFARRREKREIKAGSRALEDRRDKLKLPVKKGSPTVNKLKKGGFPWHLLGKGTAIWQAGKLIARGLLALLPTATVAWLTKFGLGSGKTRGLPGGRATGPGRAPAGGSTPGGRSTGPGRAPAGGSTPKPKGWSRLTDIWTRPRQTGTWYSRPGSTASWPTGPEARGYKPSPTSGSPSMVKEGSKLFKNTNAILKTGTKFVKGVGGFISKWSPYLTAALSGVEIYLNETNENLDETEKRIAHAKTGGGLAGMAAGAAAGLPLAGFTFGLSSLIGSGIGYFLGREITETVAEEISDKTNISNKSGNVTLSQEEKVALADAAEDSGAVDTG